MSSISIAGDTSGAVTLAAPAIAGTNTMTLLAATGNLGPKVLSTAVASTSGTSIDFTGIPSWVVRITVMLNGVSTNGSSNWLIQLGTSSGVESSGYLGAVSVSGNTVAGGASNFSSGFLINASNATFVAQGAIVFTLLGSNVWVGNGVLGRSDAINTIQLSGGKTLAATLDRVRITTVAGTDTFDAGSINILYE